MDSSLVVTVSSRLSRAWNFSSMLLRAKKVVRVGELLSRAAPPAGDLRNSELFLLAFEQSANRHRCNSAVLTSPRCAVQISCREIDHRTFRTLDHRGWRRSNNQCRRSLCGPPRRCVSSAEEHCLLASCPPPPRRSRSRSLRRARRQLRPRGRLAGTMRMLRCRRRS